MRQKKTPQNYFIYVFSPHHSIDFRFEKKIEEKQRKKNSK